MGAILGIDAAWTSHHPSGVALVRETSSGGWECVAVESSYSAFIRRSGKDFPAIYSGTVPIQETIDAAKKLAGEDIRLVAADIPLANIPITRRRSSDNRVSELYGKLGCGTHSPNLNRPGKISEEIRDGFQQLGFRLATKPLELSNRALIEVFPHPALLALMNESYRYPYKVTKARKYWPDLQLIERRAKFTQQFDRILEKLAPCIGGISLTRADTKLKETEDKIDALICAWVGILALRGDAVPLGDSDSAIWVPSTSLHLR